MFLDVDEIPDHMTAIQECFQRAPAVTILVATKLK